MTRKRSTGEKNPDELTSHYSICHNGSAAFYCQTLSASITLSFYTPHHLESSRHHQSLNQTTVTAESVAVAADFVVKILLSSGGRFKRALEIY